MAKARVIIKRRKAVRNIKKITKVMQMIATSRYQKAYKRATGTKPYVKKIGELVASAVQALRASGKDVDHPLLKEPGKGPGGGGGGKKTAVLAISSNRGLAGGYNGNVLRLANQTLKELEAAGDSPVLFVSGKKGIAYFKFLRRSIAESFTALGDNPIFTEIEKLAEQFMAGYQEGRFSGLKIVYMRFISAGQQKPAVMDVLPLTNLATEGAGAQGGEAAPVLYEFLPSAEGILNELIPVVVKISIFQAFIEAAVSEQIARMVAMKAATDNAEKMGKKLTQDYNRARQSQITSELSELMGGVEALK
ncbi:MAG TPA: ATP synthase F1 subunit gamma [Phycisphaerae bacterium]|jgi:F-type H+-transporting ATPase subunit gamma|nr:ATP synthase F1 subunit gamma [Phycisphaerae bacterium]